jgi:hypothetical protein
MNTKLAAPSSLMGRAEALNAISKREKYQRAEVEARRAIEDRCGLVVHEANIILRSNCPNIDLVAFAYSSPIYVQVKSSEKPASRDHVTISGAMERGLAFVQRRGAVDGHVKGRSRPILFRFAQPNATDGYAGAPVRRGIPRTEGLGK